MSKGFKKIPFEQRAGLLTLKGARLHVWLAHYLRSDKDDEIEISNPQLVRETGYDLSTVKIAKRWLKENGWLVVDREAYRGDNGEWVTPVFKAIFSEGVKDPLDSDQGGKDTLGPGLKTQPGSRAENTAAGKSAPFVDTLSGVDTSESDASRLPVNTEEEAVEDSSAASEISKPQTNEDIGGEDIDADYRKFSVETYLLPIAGDYKLNGNCREEAEKLYDLLEEVHLADNQIGAVIKFHRHSSDPFMSERIATWSGLFSMLQKPGLIQQFRDAQRKAAQLNPSAYQQAMEHYGSSAFGIAVAKIIEDKKAKKKSRPQYGDDESARQIASEVPSSLRRKS